MEEAQQRGQANYSGTQLRAEGERTCQQTVWLINVFCHRRRHLCNLQSKAKTMKPKISDCYAKWEIQQEIRGVKNIIRLFHPLLFSRTNWGWDLILSHSGTCAAGFD